MFPVRSAPDLTSDEARKMPPDVDEVGWAEVGFFPFQIGPTALYLIAHTSLRCTLHGLKCSRFACTAPHCLTSVSPHDRHLERDTERSQPSRGFPRAPSPGGTGSLTSMTIDTLARLHKRTGSVRSGPSAWYLRDPSLRSSLSFSQCSVYFIVCPFCPWLSQFASGPRL